MVPEAATMLMKAGAMIVSSNMTQSEGFEFQKALMRLQIGLEDSFMDLATQMDSNVVILIDRGLLDGSAFVQKY